jgi:hypothetical protein
MAARRRTEKKLEIQEAAGEQAQETRIPFEESIIFVTTAVLVCGIVMVFILLGRYDAGLF